MRILPLILPLLALTACAPSTGSMSDNAIVGSGIVGGTEVKMGDKVARSTVMVWNVRTGTMCTGTLIATDLVLTAAHCVSKMEMVSIPENPAAAINGTGEGGFKLHQELVKADASDLSVRVGERPLNHPDETSEVSSFIQHEEYTGAKSQRRHDLALIRLKNKFVRATPIGLALTEDLETQRGFSVAGYGVTTGIKEVLEQNRINKTDPTGVLRSAPLSRAMVVDRLRLSLNQMNGSGACYGDSGGPVYLTKPDGKMVLAGVMSFVYTFDDTQEFPDKPYNHCTQLATAMNVTGYRAWISKTAATLRALPAPTSVETRP